MVDGDGRKAGSDDHRERQIREHAYRLWEEAGRPHGRDAEHWDQARRHIEENSGSETGSLPGPLVEGAEPLELDEGPIGVTASQDVAPALAPGGKGKPRKALETKPAPAAAPRAPEAKGAGKGRAKR